MNYLKRTLALLSIAAVCIVISCKQSGNDDEEPDFPGQSKAEELSAGTWAPVAGGVTVNNTPRDEWDGFTLNFTVDTDTYAGGSFTTSGRPSDDGASDVWGASGDWEFAPNGDGLDLSTIYRNGDESQPISLSVDIDETSGDGALSLTFSVPDDASNRTAGFSGTWTFTFELSGN